MSEIIWAGGPSRKMVDDQKNNVSLLQGHPIIGWWYLHSQCSFLLLWCFFLCLFTFGHPIIGWWYLHSQCSFLLLLFFFLLLWCFLCLFTSGFMSFILFIQDGEWTLGISLILGKQFHIFEIPLLTFWNNFPGGESEMGLFSTNKEGNFQKIGRAAL